MDPTMKAALMIAWMSAFPIGLLILGVSLWRRRHPDATCDELGDFIVGGSWASLLPGIDD